MTGNDKRQRMKTQKQRLRSLTLGALQHRLVVPDPTQNVPGKCFRLFVTVELRNKEILKGSLLFYFHTIVIATSVAFWHTEVVEAESHSLNEVLLTPKNFLCRVTN